MAELNLDISADDAIRAFDRIDLIVPSSHSVPGLGNIEIRTAVIEQAQQIKPRRTRTVKWNLDAAISQSGENKDDVAQWENTIDALLQGATNAAQQIGSVPDISGFTRAVTTTYRRLSRIWTPNLALTTFRLREMPVRFEGRAGRTLKVTGRLYADATWLMNDPDDPEDNIAWFQMEKMKLQTNHECQKEGALNPQSPDRSLLSKGYTWFTPRNDNDYYGAFLAELIGECSTEVQEDEVKVGFDLSLTGIAEDTIAVYLRQIRLQLDVALADERRRGERRE